MWKYSNPVNVIFSESFHKDVENIVNSRKNILVICSERFKKTKDFGNLNETLKDFRCFSDTENNPSFKNCQKALNYVKDFKPDTIIAIGGGSVIDTAKAVRMAVYKSLYNIEKLLENSIKKTNKPVMVAIPTTHGTSSELTMWATIWDKVNKKKYSLSEFDNYPDFAIYDVNLLKSLPISISISSTLDALSHSFEALWNKNSNPISDNFSMHSIRLIVNNLRNLREPVSIETREVLLKATIYAGLAFSNTKTAAAHSISYPLTAYFNIPHGIACSMPIYPLLKINEEAMGDKISNLLDMLKFKSVDKLWDRISKVVENRIPFSLHEYGVKKTDLNWLVDLSFTKGRIDNNTIELEKKDVLSILNEIY
jgi:alcohol dehydrogenase class IV